MKWTHDNLMRDLAAHLRSNTAIVAWEDMQLGPSGTCRPDVYVMPKSFANFRPMAYEIKVSVADFRSDVTSGKWQNYLRYACGVIFAVPAGLITKDDLPPGCGLIVRHENIWRTVRKPTLSKLDSLPRDAWIKLLIDGMEREVERYRIKERAAVTNQWIAAARLRRRHGDELAELVARALRSKENLLEAIQRDEATIKEIHAGTHRFLQDVEKRAAYERSRLDGDLRDLARVLGMDPINTTVRELSSALSRVIDRMPIDEEIKRLRRKLDAVIKAATEGLEPLPGEKTA